MSTFIVTADHVCVAMADVLEAQIYGLVQGLDLTGQLTKPVSWQQVPNPEALSTARFPAGLVTSPGFTDTPRRHGDGSYDATWRVVAGIADRGGSYDETAFKIRTWAALIRAVVLRNPTLDGVASSTRWVTEEYAERPEKNTARTIGGCAVAFDVTVRNILDLAALDEITTPGYPSPATGVVESTFSTVTIRPPEEE